MSKKITPPDTHRHWQVNGTEIPYCIRTSLKAKHVRLRVSPDEGLTVIVPRRQDLSKIESLLEEKRSWVLTHLDRLAKAPKHHNRVYQEGTLIAYLGNDYSLHIERTPTSKAAIQLVDKILHISIPTQATADDSQDIIKRLLEEWYKHQAHVYFPKRVAHLNRTMGMTYNRIFIKNQKTRWGSCSSKQNLNFNWRLVMAPSEVVDYIIIHELAHLKELNHSARFWKVVETHCPSYRNAEKWLKENGASLVI